jgi:Tat protein secretion system quality control protein TatD with DNase activity
MDHSIEHGCGAIIAWTSEYDKQQILSTLAKDRPGILYAMTGIHPDNVDKTNKKLHADWLKAIEELGKAPACIALLTGLNLSRDAATHFSQESLLKDICHLAVDQLKLPVVLHQPHHDLDSLRRALELALECVGDPQRIILHNIAYCTGGDLEMMEHVAASGVHITVSAYGLCDDIEATNAERVSTGLRFFDPSRILLCTNSPWSTPQTLEDEYLRQLPNEPANIGEVAKAVATALGIPHPDFLKVATANAIRVFDLIPVDKGPAPSATNDEESEEESESEGEEENNGAEGEEATQGDGDTTKQQGEEETLPSVVAECPPRENTSANVSYSCVKCRATLFMDTQLVTHPVGSTQTAFKPSARGAGSCHTALFLLEKAILSKAAPGLAIQDDNLECSHCGGKLGSVGCDVPCPCGLVLPGRTVRVLASRVDRNEELSHEELMARAAREREEAEAQAQEEPSSDSDDGRKKKGPKQNVKKQNKMNMSSFRNKGAVPKKVLVATEVEVMKSTTGGTPTDTAKKANKKGKRRGQESDDE